LSTRAFICSLAGPDLSADERAFLADARPWGVILFARNVEASQQIRRLCDAVRQALGREDAPVLIDQEGGRVQRIGPPILRAYPPGASYGRLYRRDPFLGFEAARLGAKLIGLDLAALGITVNCVPVLDVRAPDSSPVIGERAYGEDADTVVTLGMAAAGGLMSAGVLPVMKHMPGHGRARLDSHKALPVVEAPLAELEAVDFAPFRLAAPHFLLGMTAHIVFTAVDGSAPATQSAAVIGTIIRERIGFGGALMTDDISMGALSGDLCERASRAYSAGCDLVLHCNGDFDEMQDVARAAPLLEGERLSRTQAALAAVRSTAAEPVDRAALEARFDHLIALADAA
jgi:beta-N-acetylhexosaminidase